MCNEKVGGRMSDKTNNKQTISKQLANCPFCGNNDYRIKVRRMGSNGYRVICGKCGSSGPYVAIREWHDNKMIAQGQAIKAWNERA